MAEPFTDGYLRFLERVLTPARLKHSLGVMQVMQELAGVYRLDREKAITAGLLHDAAKDLPPEQQRRLSEEGGLGIQNFGDLPYALYLHGPVGAYFVRKSLGIQDETVLDAIAMHGYCGDGAKFHAPFNWCLRFADLLEPNRGLSDANWAVERRWYAQGRVRMWALVLDGKLLEAGLFQTGWLIAMFDEKGLPVSAKMRAVLADLSARLQVDETFFGY